MSCIIQNDSLHWKMRIAHLLHTYVVILIAYRYGSSVVNRMLNTMKTWRHTIGVIPNTLNSIRLIHCFLCLVSTSARKAHLVKLWYSTWKVSCQCIILCKLQFEPGFFVVWSDVMMPCISFMFVVGFQTALRCNALWGTSLTMFSVRGTTTTTCCRETCTGLAIFPLAPLFISTRWDCRTLSLVCEFT